MYIECIYIRPETETHTQPRPTTEYTMKKQTTSETIKTAKIAKWENGIYWLIDVKTDEPIDGDKRLYVVKDMAKRWGFKVIK